MLEVLDDLLWALRREGFAIAPPQAIDVAKVAGEVGFVDRDVLRESLACVLAGSRREREQFRTVFDSFFSTEKPPLGFWERLQAQGFADAELEALRDLMDQAASAGAGGGFDLFLGGQGQLDSLLSAAGVRRLLDAMNNALQVGFYAQKVGERVGLGQAAATLARMRKELSALLGDERARLLADALAAEIERAHQRVRDHVQDTLRRRTRDPKLDKRARRLLSSPFTSLTDAELEEVVRAVRRFAERLRGAARVRQRHARRGRFDPHRTVRKSMATGGIPFRPARRDQRRDKPKLVILCDVSDSVRTAARFMLEFVYAVQELFERTKSFVFVGELGEVTHLFEKERVDVAMAKAYGGSVINVNDNSSYGRVFAMFEARHMAAIDRRTTVVVLGDGRTNNRPHGAEILGRIRERARGIYWLCPEGRETWGIGDSAMPVYTTKVDRVLEVRTAADLERAARQLIARG